MQACETTRTKTDVTASPVRDGEVSVSGLTHLPQLFSEMGLDPISLLADSGLALDAFDDPAGQVSVAATGHLIALAAAQSGRQDIGLRIGMRSGAGAIGIVGRLTRTAPDVGTALRQLIDHLHMRDRAAVAVLEQDDYSVTLGYEPYQVGVEASAHICDVGMAMATNIMRDLCGPGWCPAEVRFAHRAPSDPILYRRFFRSPLRFNAERTVLVFPARWLSYPSRWADAATHATLLDQVLLAESSSPGDPIADFRRLLRASLVSGQRSRGEVARQLALHPRTMNRRLSANGTTFRRLFDETRFEMARQLIENTLLPFTEIAGVLGYGDSSAFARACRRWTGVAPSGWRAEKDVMPG